MNSRNKSQECFVYIVLPGETEFVTAGRFKLSTDRSGLPIGKFVYGKSYVARSEAVPIDPFTLKLGTKTYETKMLKGIFSAFRDASPDYWGRRVIEKHAGKTQLDEIDYLLYSADDRAGALGFGLNQIPPAPRRNFNKTLELEKLQKLADAIIADEELPINAEVEQVQEMLLVGTSMGGARPKAVVEDKDGLWIAKFNCPDDKWNYARIEHVMMKLAQKCGLETVISKFVTIGDRDALLIKRFDRQKTKNGYLRARMLSALTLLRAEDTHQNRDKWSYILLVEELRRISGQPKYDAPELFRRMCFNALISNSDDHPRNHAVIAIDNDWKLSPAYDLTPSAPVSIERRDLALICGDNGRYAHAENLLSQCRRFLLNEEEAKHIIDGMEKIVKAQWYEVARRENVSEKDCEKIKGAFAYPGFRMKAQFINS
jgi:serine/threonine-protein kinase HipA